MTKKRRGEGITTKIAKVACSVVYDTKSVPDIGVGRPKGRIIQSSLRFFVLQYATT